jgi:Luciferase-like monooxygenase
VKYGFVLPRGDARTAADFAQAAETSGWDGFFVWEPVWGVDAWVSLTAAAMRTERIRLGTMLSPLSRMRPWKLASETATLDNLSGGRVILAVGLGAVDTGFEAFGEETDRKQRAELLDEGLDILTGLWRGQPFEYQGKHYKIHATDFHVPTAPVQRPRIPIWVVGAWPSQKSLRRVLRYDGLLPAVLDQTGRVRMSTVNPEELKEMKIWVEANRRIATSFDYVVEGETPGNDPGKAQSVVRPYVEAGATWWIESLWSEKDLGPVLKRIRQGPPD